MSNSIVNKRIKHGVIGFTQASIGNCLLAIPFLNNPMRYNKEGVRIGYYHIVSGESKEYLFDNKKISPEIFEQHISFFSKHFDIVSMTEALQMVERKQSLHRKLVLTFDDGFVENYNIVVPILKKRKIPATFFLIGNCIDNKDLMWRNKLLVITRRAGHKLSKIMAEATAKFRLPAIYNREDLLHWSMRAWPMLKKEEIANYCWNAADIGTVQAYLEEHKPFLTSEQIRCMINDGFEIGSHSMTHPVFSRLSYEEFEKEILGSVQLLQTTFGKAITSFSYPFGIKASDQFEQKLLTGDQVSIKTFLGSKNRANNGLDCLHWERDNLEFRMNELLFRLNIVPWLRRFA